MHAVTNAVDERETRASEVSEAAPEDCRAWSPLTHNIMDVLSPVTPPEPKKVRIVRGKGSVGSCELLAASRRALR